MRSGSDVAVAHSDMWVIEPRQHGAFSRLRELWAYRYLWWYFASETIVSLYRGSMLGWLWLLLRVIAPVVAGSSGSITGSRNSAGAVFSSCFRYAST